MRTALIRPALLAATTVLLASPLLAGCGGGSSTAADPNAKITLTLNLFGDFGYHDLYKQYEASHPNITIKENVTDYGTHHKNLQAHLLAQSGTADIEAIEIGQVAGFQQQAAKFVNYLEQGVSTDQWTEAKWQAAAGPDHKQLFGLGTDVGGMALCYRSDLFAAAGLPTDPSQVAALVPDWPSYVAVGKQFVEKTPDKSVKWFDAGSNVFNAQLAQAPEGFYDSAGRVIVASNPAVKAAWDSLVSAINAGESAGIAAFTPQWNTGFAKGQFATVTCPSWLMAEIRTHAPTTSGKWNIARVPGSGGGNWGGSYLTVPKQGGHVQAAVELAKWLTAPEQEAWLFKNKGNFPSDKALWSQPEITNYTDPFFSGAPLGKIFSDSLKSQQPQPLGAHAGDIGNAIGNALVAVEQGKATSDAAWQQALAEVKNMTA